MRDHRSLPLAVGSGSPTRLDYGYGGHFTFYIHENGKLVTRIEPVDTEDN